METGPMSYALGESVEGCRSTDTGPAVAMELRLLTYLSPGLPLELFGAVADYLRRSPHLGGREIALASEERFSGPGRDSVERSEDHFSRREADVGFLCAPTYLQLREREHRLQRSEAPAGADPGP